MFSDQVQPVERVRPPESADERATVSGLLDFHRATVVNKLAGLLTGAASIPGLLTKGDVDLHLRVPEDDFASVVTSLRDLYAPASQRAWAATLAVFEVPDQPLPTGLAVTPAHSEHDRRFTLAWQLLTNNPALRTQYNSLKQSADDTDYEPRKSTFFSDLTNT